MLRSALVHILPCLFKALCHGFAGVAVTDFQLDDNLLLFALVEPHQEQIRPVSSSAIDAVCTILKAAPSNLISLS